MNLTAIEKDLNPNAKHEAALQKPRVYLQTTDAVVCYKLPRSQNTHYSTGMHMYMSAHCRAHRSTTDDTQQSNTMWRC